MGKPYIMPDAKYFIQRKKACSKKKEEVWVYLEREMREDTSKPYNTKVGEWLKYLRDLKYYYAREAKKKRSRIIKDVGPTWYIEFSTKQRKVLEHIEDDIYKDMMEFNARRTAKSLKELGIYMHIPSATILKVMREAEGDAGLFFWFLYKDLYKLPPSVLRKSYDLNAMIIMSSMAQVDYPECLEALKQLTKRKPPPPPPPEKPKPRTYFEPQEKHGMYLQQLFVPLTCPHPSITELNVKKPVPELENKLKLRNAESLEKILHDTSFIEKRLQRRRNKNLKDTKPKSASTYKFWEPPPATRCRDKKMIKYLMKLKMVKMKAKATYQSHKPPLDNVQFHVGTVAYIREKPVFLVNTISWLPTGYLPLHNGFVQLKTGEYITCIGGHWKYPREEAEVCDVECSCMNKWEPAVMKYLEESKCKCGHLYDLYNEGKPKEKYFYQPTNNLPHFFDYAKVYQFDSTEDFIKETVAVALQSKEITPHASTHIIEAAVLRDCALTSVYLADLADTHLVIPHLPEASFIRNIQAFVRERVRGPVPEKLHKHWKIRSERNWFFLDHEHFKARTLFIPFTYRQRQNMTWKHRGLVQELAEYILNDFRLRNQLKMVEQSRLLYPTMMNEYYESKNGKTFLDMFFTYLPARVQDTYVLNPYNPNIINRTKAKTCPLK